MFLTIKDIKELTRSKSRGRAIAWLKEHRYPFDIGDDGWPVVLTSYVEAKLGGIPKTREPQVRLANAP